GHEHSGPLERYVTHQDPTEDSQLLHGGLIWFNQVGKPAVEARLGLWVVGPLPPPEELLDIGHVRSAGDGLDGLVINGQHGRSDKGLATRTGQLDLDLRLLAGLVTVLGRFDGQIDHARLGRDGDLAGLGVNPSIGDGEPFHEQVWHVPRHNADLLDRALAAQAEDPGRKVDAIRRTDEEQYRRVHLVGIDQQPERVAGPI